MPTPPGSGWGFVAEDPAFADLCEQLGVTFIGPSAEAMRRLGDKIGSKLIAEEVGVPVAPWSRGAVDTLDDALAAAKGIGYPLMLKATAGGGGRGIRVVASDGRPRATPTSAPATRRQRAFGSGVVFLERLVTGARHVEVQVIADGQGTAWALGRARLLGAAPQPEGHRGVRLAGAGRRAGRPSSRRRPSGSRSPSATAAPARSSSSTTRRSDSFAFLEVNTRLQVEHPITELTTDLDLVKAQIHVAAGGRLEGDAAGRAGPRRRGAAQRRGPRP